MKHRVIENFLDKTFYKRLKETVTHLNFPWRKMQGSTGPNTPTDKGYFTNNIFCDFFINDSEMHYNYMYPILLKLKAKSIIEARVNMFINQLFIEDKGNYHTDYPFICNTGILNFTDSDGGTQLKIKDKEIIIHSKENQLLLFDSNIPHRTVVPKNTDIRYILNFNYF